MSRLQKPSLQVQVLVPQESSSDPVTLILDSFLMGVGFSVLPADPKWCHLERVKGDTVEIRVVNSKLDERQPHDEEGRWSETSRGRATWGRLGQGQVPSWDFRFGKGVKTGSKSNSLKFKAARKSSSQKRHL